jgi:hypothetical protein
MGDDFIPHVARRGGRFFTLKALALSKSEVPEKLYR